MGILFNEMKNLSIQQAWEEYQADGSGKTFAQEAKEAFEFYVSHDYSASFRWIKTTALKKHMEGYFEYLSCFDRKEAVKKLSWRCEELMRHGRIFKHCYEHYGDVPPAVVENIWKLGKLPEDVQNMYCDVANTYFMNLYSFLDVWVKSRKRIQIAYHRIGIVFKAFDNAGFCPNSKGWDARYNIAWPSQRVVLNLPRFHNWARGYAAVSVWCTRSDLIWPERSLILLGRLSAPCREYVLTKLRKEEEPDVRTNGIEAVVQEWQDIPLKERMAPCNMGQRRWKYYTHRLAPMGLQWKDPKTFNFKAFKYLHERFEFTEDAAMNIAAFNLSASMQGNTERYFEKWGEGRVHDSGQYFDGCPLNKAWQDFILKYGPEAAKLSKFSKDILLPPKSLRELRNMAAHIMYPGLGDRLASACAGVKLTQEQAEEYAQYLSDRKPKSFESCPCVDLTLEGYRFYKLEYDDPRGPLLGLYTDCCQHPHGAGARCAENGYMSGYGAFYVVEHKGAIIGQSWAWRGGRDLNTLCFDNIELLSNAYGPTVLKLYTEAARRMLGQLGIERVTVGLGYNDLQELEALQSDMVGAMPVDYTGYRDSHNQKILYTMLEE